MDWLVEHAIWTWIAVYFVLAAAYALLWLARFVIWLLRRLPPLDEPLEPLTGTLAGMTSLVGGGGMATLALGLLAPVLVIAGPVIAFGVFIMKLFVPGAPSTGHAHGAGHPWWPSFATMNWPLRPITVTALAQVLAVAAMLWLRKEPITPIEKVLEGEEIARQGLIWLGAPVLLLRFLLGWAKAHPAEPEGELRLRRY